MSRVSIPAANLRQTVHQAARAAAGLAGGGKAILEGYDEKSGMFEYQVDRGDGTRQIVCVQLVLECFTGIPSVDAGFLATGGHGSNTDDATKRRAA